MIALLFDALAWVCLLTGGLFSVIGGIGLLRLPDFFTRLHAGGITDTLGAWLILLGLAFQAGWSLVALKLVLIFAFLLLTSPTACHAVAKAALHSGLRPLLKETPGCSEEERSSTT